MKKMILNNFSNSHSVIKRKCLTFLFYFSHLCNFNFLSYTIKQRGNYFYRLAGGGKEETVFFFSFHYFTICQRVGSGQVGRVIRLQISLDYRVKHFYDDFLPLYSLFVCWNRINSSSRSFRSFRLHSSWK